MLIHVVIWLLHMSSISSARRQLCLLDSLLHSWHSVQCLGIGSVLHVIFKNVSLNIYSIYLAVLGLSCSTRDLSLQCTVSVVVAHRLSCSESCGMLVPQPGVKPVSPVLQDGFITTGLPGKCLRVFIDWTNEWVNELGQSIRHGD